MSVPFRVVAHASPLDPYRASSPTLPGQAPTVDLTRWVSSVSWTDSLNARANGLSVELEIVEKQLHRLLPGLVTRMAPTNEPDPITNEQDAESQPQWGRNPGTGWWISVHGFHSDGRKQAFCFGYVTSVSATESADPTTGNHETRMVVQAESFFSWLARSKYQMAASPSAWGKDGFVYRVNAWGEKITAICKSLFTKPMGSLFEQLWPAMVKTKFPETLTSQTAGEAIKIVWNEETASRYSPRRAGQCIAVPGNQRQFIHAGQYGYHIASFFESLFGADPRFVEMFPSIEPVDEDTGDDPLENAIGGRLVMVYRLKPFITKPISAKSIKELYFRDSGPTACERIQIAQTLSKTVPTGYPASMFDTPAHEVEAVQLTWSEGDRVNLTYGAHFGAADGNAFYGLLGTPLVRSDKTIEYHGLRTAELQWPFFPSSAYLQGVAGVNSLLQAVNKAFNTTFTLPPDEAAIKPYEDAITELTWAVLGEGEQYARATVRIGMVKPWLRQGMWVTVRTGHRTLTGYTDAAQHSIRVSGNGTVIGSTTLILCRVTSSPDKPEYRSSIMTASLNPAGTPADLGFSLDESSPFQQLVSQSNQVSTFDVSVLLPDTQLTQDLKAVEFASKPDATLPPQEYWNNLFLLATNLQKIRDRVGKPIVIVSGYRSKERNTAVGGAVRSQHLVAKAADITIPGMSNADLYTLICDMIKEGAITKGAVILYEGWVHYDIRGVYMPLGKAKKK